MTSNKTKRPEITNSQRPESKTVDVYDEYNQVKSFQITGELPLTIYLNKKDRVVIVLGVILAIVYALDYFQIFSFNPISEWIFYMFYEDKILAIIPIIILAFTFKISSLLGVSPPTPKFLQSSTRLAPPFSPFIAD